MIKRNSISVYITFFFIFIIYILNLYIDGNQSLWSDEAFSVNVARKSIAEIIRISSLDTLPPLHVLLLHVWIKIFSTSEYAVRSLSTVFAILTLVTFYKLTQHIFKDKGERVISTLFFAVNPLMLYYAAETRPYSVLIFFTTLLIYSVIQRLKVASFNSYLLFIFAAVCGLYSHSIFCIVIVGIFFWEVFLNWKYNPSFIKTKKYFPLIFTYLIVGILFLPWIYPLLFVIDRANSDGFWVQFKPIRDLFDTYLYFFSMHIDFYSFYFFVAVTVYMLGTLFVIKNFFSKQKNYYITQLFLSFIAFIWLLSFKIPLFYIRYLLFALPLFSIMVSNGYIELKKNISLEKWYLTGLIFLLFQPSAYFITYPEKTSYKDAIYDISLDSRKKLILHGNAASFHSFLYYGTPGYIYDPERDLPYYQGIANLKETDYFAGTINQYEVVYVPKVWDEEVLDEYLIQNGFIKNKTKEFGYPLAIETWVRQ